MTVSEGASARAATVDSSCPVCAAGSAPLLKQEERNGKLYRSFRCVSCRAIFCPDHHAAVSPDYVDRTAADIDAEVLWCQGVHKQAAFEQLFRLLRRRGNRISSVLDVGCGTGGFLAYAKTRGTTELYGFDAAKAQVAVAAQLSPDVRCCTSVTDYVRSLGRTPHWDLITLWDVIEHVREPRSLLADLHQYCDKDTLVFLCTPNAICEFLKLHLRRVFSVAHSFIPWEHVLYYSPQALRSMLQQNGFEVVCLTGAVCYDRAPGALEFLRRLGFALTRKTPLVPQLFVLARKS